MEIEIFNCAVARLMLFYKSYQYHESEEIIQTYYTEQLYKTFILLNVPYGYIIFSSSDFIHINIIHIK